MFRSFAAFFALVLALAACTTPIADLRVTSVSPERDATGIAIDSVITATFNVDVVEASLDNNFVLSSGGEVVAGAMAYDAASRTATFTPDADLEYATAYTATVSGDVRTPAGARLSEEASWSFTTEADPTPDPAVTGVAINEGDQSLLVGGDVQLSVTVTATGGASEDVVWSSGDAGVATVSATGLVEAVAVGVTAITVTSVVDSSVSDSITVTVTAAPAVTAVVINEEDQSLAVGGEVQLSVTVTATGGASEDVVWSSGDAGVATVSATGLVEAVAVGVTAITATSEFDPSVSDSITVDVVAVGTGAAAGFLQGTYVSMTNLSVITPDFTSGTRIVEFDISWDESWRGAMRPTWVEANDNWDAAWVFVKFSVGGGPWQHATLATSGHTVPTGAVIDTPSDGKGVFIHRDADGYGTFSADGVGLVWDYAADSVDIADDVDLRLFAVEMVYVPQGSFFVGSGGNATGEFREGGSTNSPFQVVSQSAITLGDAAGQLFWTEGTNTGSPTGSTNASFPTGFEAAYFMKYQLTQGQYVDFLNTLTQSQATTRKYTFVANPLFRYRYDVEGFAVGSYSTNVPYLPINWITWADGAAYADWAGLRPMTELEYEKAARGTNTPVANEYAWGSTTIVSATGLLDAGTVNEIPQPGDANAAFGDNNPPDGPVRVGSFAAPGRSRVLAGASYYGLLELSGNLSERPVTVGNSEGRSFTAAHGDGELDGSGNATVSGWPSNLDALGAGFRGGTHFTSALELLRASGRAEASNEGAAPNRAGVFGWRGARSAP